MLRLTSLFVFIIIQNAFEKWWEKKYTKRFLEEKKRKYIQIPLFEQALPPTSCHLK